MNWDPLQAEANPEKHSRPQRMAQAAPRPDVDDDAVVLEAAHSCRLLCVLSSVELDEEGIWLMPGDSDIPLLQAELVQDDSFDFSDARGSRGTHRFDD